MSSADRATHYRWDDLPKEPLKEGLSQETAKKISKIIREQGPKNVKAQITGDELRVSGKSRDDLQAVIALLKDTDLDVALQFVNYR